MKVYIIEELGEESNSGVFDTLDKSIKHVYELLDDVKREYYTFVKDGDYIVNFYADSQMKEASRYYVHIYEIV